jgi:hypothetical protein
VGFDVSLCLLTNWHEADGSDGCLCPAPTSAAAVDEDCTQLRRTHARRVLSILNVCYSVELLFDRCSCSARHGMNLTIATRSHLWRWPQTCWTCEGA